MIGQIDSTLVKDLEHPLPSRFELRLFFICAAPFFQRIHSTDQWQVPMGSVSPLERAEACCWTVLITRFMSYRLAILS